MDMGGCSSCGSNGDCPCLIEASNSLTNLTTVVGNGSAGTPYIVGTECEAVQDCVAPMLLGQGFVYNDLTNEWDNPGTAGQVLTSDGAGSASFSSSSTTGISTHLMCDTTTGEMVGFAKILGDGTFEYIDENGVPQGSSLPLGWGDCCCGGSDVPQVFQVNGEEGLTTATRNWSAGVGITTSAIYTKTITPVSYPRFFFIYMRGYFECQGSNGQWSRGAGYLDVDLNTGAFVLHTASPLFFNASGIPVAPNAAIRDTITVSFFFIIPSSTAYTFRYRTRAEVTSTSASPAGFVDATLRMNSWEVRAS